MGKPRIMVFQMKELIKIAMIVIVAVLLIGVLIFFLLPKDKSGDQVYKPGTYSAQIILHNKPIDILVTVDKNSIQGIELVNMNENQEVFYPLFKPTIGELSEQIIKFQSTKIATSPETAVTSRILLDAVDAAIAQAEPEAN